jgi:hypothetical protein
MEYKANPPKGRPRNVLACQTRNVVAISPPFSAFLQQGIVAQMG